MTNLQALTPHISQSAEPATRWPAFVAAVFLLWGVAAVSVRAETNWFTVLGDTSDPLATTVAVDPVPQSVQGEQRTMRVRVNRPVERVTRDGVRFRSFQSSVLFDCTQKTARYVSVDFFLQPLWAGETYKSVTYPASDIRAMEFREVNPNPRDRIIRAACLSSGGSSSGNASGSTTGSSTPTHTTTPTTTTTTAN